MATVKWTAPTSRTTGISSQSIAAGANYLGSEINNETNLDRFCSVTIDFTPGTAPTANTTLEVYFIYDPTSADYEDGDATPTDPKKAPVAVFAAKASTSAQRIVADNIPLPPFAFKVLVKSELDQTATVTVELETYNESVA